MSTTTVPAPAINLARRQDLFSSHIVATALKQSVLMLRPDVQWKNPRSEERRVGKECVG